jgi:hypothetical protein
VRELRADSLLKVVDKCCAERALRIGYKSLVEAMTGCFPLAEANSLTPETEKGKGGIKNVRDRHVTAGQVHTWRLDWAATIATLCRGLIGSLL